MMRTCTICLVLAIAACAPPPGPTTAGHGFTIDDLVDIKHPSSPVWSPDGTRVAFVWDRAGVSNIYVSGVDGGTPRQVTDEPEGLASTPLWSGDGRFVYFMKDGDLWQAPADGGAPSAVWTTPGRESDVVLSPDRSQAAFVRPAPSGGSELCVQAMPNGAARVLAADPKGIGAVAWAPDGARLSYAAGAHGIRHEQTPDYSGAKIIYTITERVAGQAYVVPAAGGRPVAVQGASGGVRWVDNGTVVYDRQSSDFKRRTTYTADARSGAARALREDVDEKFWSIPGNTGAAAQPSPDGKWIAFLSDRDGWDHLYVMAAGGGEPVQVTSGRFEAWRPSWSPDGTRIAFDANLDGKPGTRHLGVATIGGAGTPTATVTMITEGAGTNIAPEWSPDGRRLVYQHTDAQNSADLYVLDVESKGAPVRISDSLPAAIDRSTLVAPEYVTYPGADGTPVPGWLFVPPGLDRSQKHPAIVWIHGDGVNQNYDGWHVQRNYAVYYSFHQYLLQQGYVVFAPDYRGSIGYGRDWRQGVYMDVGGRDAKDAWMAANYLKTLPYVDADRMGVWGLSYGGFFTLIAVTDEPTLFRAGVDVAGVVDYAMYYEDPYHGGWTASRIGTPEEHPDVYEKASPLSHVDRLARPLLILHGTSDVNVPYLHSVRLADELLKKGKGELFEFMTYPGEFHYFTRAHVLRDAWTRVDQFFATHLRGAVSAD
ncbi:MAG: S9 family peptidase [Vicinamibacterales bacterium]